MDRQQGLLHRILDIGVSRARTRESGARHRPHRTTDVLQEPPVCALVARDRGPHHARPRIVRRTLDGLGFHTAFVSFRLPLQVRGNILLRRANGAADVTCSGAPAKTPTPFNRETRAWRNPNDRRRSSSFEGPCRAERRRRIQARAFRGDRRHTPRAWVFRSPRGELHGRGRRAASAPRRRSASAIHCRCTASACRSARPGRSTARICNGSRRSPSALNRRSFPSTSPGRPTRARSSTISCPCPIPRETLARVSEHIDEAQNALGRTMLLENPSTYVVFAESTWAETDFLREIARRTGCGLLLDVNNVFVSAVNHGFDPDRYLADFPLSAVGEIHLAGYAEDTDDAGLPLAHRRPQFAGSRRRLGALRRGDPPARAHADADRMGQRRARLADASRRSAPGRARDCLRDGEKPGARRCRLRPRSALSRRRSATLPPRRRRRPAGAWARPTRAASRSTATMSPSD